MLLDIVLIVIGVAMVLYGADRLTDGASALARRMNVPEIVIGLTIVAAGTSAPELFVSLVSALKGTADLAVGNVVGSNTMNCMLIVGCAALVAPMTISKSTVKKDIPFSVGASVILMFLALDDYMDHIEGVLLLIAFAGFMAYTLTQARQSQTKQQQAGQIEEEPAPQTVKQQDLWLSIVFVLLGLTMLVVGSNLFVDAASRVAYTLGVSEGVVGLTIVSGGTSLPELATSVVAARKGQSALAIGNVIGSNVFNILLILGLTATITPLDIDDITIVDMSVMLLSVVMVWLFSRTRYTVERWEGGLLVLLYLAYLGWLIASL